jgi:hypothetical protein
MQLIKAVTFQFFLQIVLELFLLFLVRLILLICVLVGVAFLTLLERKVLVFPLNITNFYARIYFTYLLKQ